jgi:hypothetical protein
VDTSPVSTIGRIDKRAWPCIRRSAPSRSGLNLAQRRWEGQPTGEYPALNPKKRKRRDGDLTAVPQAMGVLRRGLPDTAVVGRAAEASA